MQSNHKPALLLFILLSAAVVLAGWALNGALLATIPFLLIVAIVIQRGCWRSHTQAVLEESLAGHYRSLLRDLPTEALCSPPVEHGEVARLADGLSDDDPSLQIAYRYFDLANTQARYIARGGVSSETAAAWRAGIREMMERSWFQSRWHRLRELHHDTLDGLPGLRVHHAHLAELLLGPAGEPLGAEGFDPSEPIRSQDDASRWFMTRCCYGTLLDAAHPARAQEYAALKVNPTYEDQWAATPMEWLTRRIEAAEIPAALLQHMHARACSIAAAHPTTTTLEFLVRAHRHVILRRNSPLRVPLALDLVGRDPQHSPIQRGRGCAADATLRQLRLIVDRLLDGTSGPEADTARRRLEDLDAPPPPHDGPAEGNHAGNTP